MVAVQLKQDITPASSHPTRRPISLPGFNRSGDKDGIKYQKNKHLKVLTFNILKIDKFSPSIQLLNIILTNI